MAGRPTDTEIIEQLTDLMACYPSRLILDGMCGDMTAKLLVWPADNQPPVVVADLPFVADPQDAFTTLLGYLEAWRLSAEKPLDDEEED